MSVDFRNGVFCVVVDLSYLLFFHKTCFYKNPPVFRKYSSALELGKMGTFPMGTLQMMLCSFDTTPSDFFLIFPALDVIFHSPDWGAFSGVPTGVWQAVFVPAVPASFRPPGANDPHPAGLPS